MKITDAAARYGVTMQAVYQRLKKNGIRVETLKDKETKELTAEGEAVLENLFGKNRKEFYQRRESLESLKAELSTAKSRIEILTVQLDAAEKARITAEETLANERAMFQRLLPSPEEKRGGLLRRLFRG